VTPLNPDRSASEPARILRRLAAICYDALLLAGVLALYTGTVIVLRGGRAVDPNTPWFTLSLIAVIGVFVCWFWTHGGQTLGMTAWRITLESSDGSPVTWKHAVIRFLAAWLSVLPLGLGFWWSLWDPDKRCWHDTLSKTALVYRRKPSASASR